MKIFIFILNNKGIIEQINSSVTELLGHTNKKIIGKSIIELFSASTDLLKNTEFDEILKNEFTEEKTLIIKGKNNKEVPVLLFKHLIETGDDIRILLVAIDRELERNYAKQRLGQILPKLKDINAGKYDEYFDFNHDDEFSGLLNELNVLTKDVRDVMSEQRRLQDSVKRSNNKLELKTLILDDTKLALKKTFDSLERERKKLVEASVELKKQLIDSERLNKDLEDSKLATLNTMKDVVKEKNNFRQQVFETKRFQQAVDLATDAVVMTSPEQKIVYCNNACEKLTGYSLQEAMGKDVNKLVSKETTKKTIEEMQKAIGGGKSFDTEELFIDNKTGKTLQVRVSIFPIKDGDRIQFFVGLLRDIHDRKAIERTKTEFVSLASHQLRTPLSAINWYTEMLLDEDAGKLNKKQSEYVGEIFRGSSRMVSLVNALLNVSRLELGTFAITPKEVNLVELLEIEIKETEKSAEKKKIKLETILDKEINKIQADPNLLSIIFQNLITNSIKYSPDKTTIEISLDNIKKNQKIGKKSIKQDGYLYKVKDQGYGIPDNQKDKIFTKLFRADNIREHDTEGTGLGLYILKSVVESVGGQIWFESKENQGTTFFVTIPNKMKQRAGARVIEKGKIDV